MRRLALIAAIGSILFIAACNRSEPASSSAPAAGATATSRLPRVAGDIRLGESRAEIEKTSGALSCRDGAGGLEICATDRARVSGHSVEIYLFRHRVVSLAYEIDPPADTWGYLDQVIAAYGKPSLSGERERDSRGRDHETFGWKDPETLYSLRYVWGFGDDGNRGLLTAFTTLWDRAAYQEWEDGVRPRSGD